MKLKICGLTYEVKYKTAEEMQGTIGLARFNDQEIWIGDNFTEQTKKIASVGFSSAYYLLINVHKLPNKITWEGMKEGGIRYSCWVGSSIENGIFPSKCWFSG